MTRACQRSLRGRISPTPDLAHPPPIPRLGLDRRRLATGTRPRTLRLKEEHVSQSEIATRLGIGGTSVRRIVAAGMTNGRACAQTTRASGTIPTGRLPLGSLLPSYRDRQGVRVRVASLPGRQTEDQDEAGDLAAREARVYDHLINSDAWRCSAVNASYVRRFLDLAASHDIPVFWILPPFRDEALSRREQSGLETSYKEFVRSVQAEYPTLIVIDGRPMGGSSATHLDPIHLSPSGASAFSTEVANVLARRLSGGPSGPEWVELRPANSPDRETTRITRLSHSPAR
jgi:hypothetical protein